MEIHMEIPIIWMPFWTFSEEKFASPFGPAKLTLGPSRLGHGGSHGCHGVFDGHHRGKCQDYRNFKRCCFVGAIRGISGITIC